MGCGITFSTLFAKTYRINKIISSSMNFRRITLTIRETLFPVAVTLAFNVILLSVMMKYGPVRHEKFYLNDDIFGRPTEVYTRCNYIEAAPYLIGLVLLNLGMVCLASFQAWKARNLSTEFAESYYIANALLVSFVAFILSIPVLFLTKENPTIDTFNTTIFVFLVCINVLLFIFVPKIRMHADSQLPVRDTTNTPVSRTPTQPSTAASLTHSTVRRIAESLGDRILTTKSSRQLATENKSLEQEVEILKKKERTLQMKNKSLQERLREFTVKSETDANSDPRPATVQAEYQNGNTTTDDDDGSSEKKHDIAANSARETIQSDRTLYSESKGPIDSTNADGDRDHSENKKEYGIGDVSSINDATDLEPTAKTTATVHEEDDKTDESQ